MVQSKKSPLKTLQFDCCLYSHSGVWSYIIHSRIYAKFESWKHFLMSWKDKTDPSKILWLLNPLTNISRKWKTMLSIKCSCVCVRHVCIWMHIFIIINFTFNFTQKENERETAHSDTCVCVFHSNVDIRARKRRFFSFILFSSLTASTW